MFRSLRADTIQVVSVLQIKENILHFVLSIQHQHQQNATTYKEFGPSGLRLPDLLCPELTNDQPVVNKQQISTRQGCLNA